MTTDVTPVPVQRRPLRRFILLVVVPAVAIATAAYLYLHAGRLVSTDNAYVKAHVVNVSPEIGGNIVSVAIEENQRVTRGDLLFQIDDAPFRIALAAAQARVAKAASDVETDRLAWRSATAEIDLHQAAAAFAKSEYERQLELNRKKMSSAQALDAARYALDAAERQLDVDRRRASTLLANLQGDANIDVTEHPDYKAALADLHKAELDLAYTRVTAPLDGVVVNRPEVGDHVERGGYAMAVVADTNLWIEANFKETQLTNIRPGQNVTIDVDTYPDRSWRGTVESISGATGAEFALLPPQNATGNWVKVVQRIPVRIAVNAEAGAPPLRMGMSCTTTVDTEHQRSWHDLLPDV
ncbi:MAG: HlyD family secretion protein [Pseudomonadales bacterium]